MRKLIWGTLALVLLLWGATWHPATGQWVYDRVQALEAWAYGFDKQNIALGELTMTVYQRRARHTSAPTLVLLHGYTASKELWLRFGEALGDAYHLVIPDLAGHGETGFDPQWSYRPQAQAERIHGLLDALQVERAVLVGNSMGGLIAANFALTYPQRTAAMVVIDPAGVPAPVASRAEKVFRQGASPFEIDSWQDFQEFYAMTMAEPPYVPTFVLKGMAARYQARKAEYIQIAEDFRNFDQLDGRLGDIAVPTLIIWGGADQLLDVSTAAVWQAQVPNNQLLLLEGVGHMPMVERPQQTANALIDFMESIPATQTEL